MIWRYRFVLLLFCALFILVLARLFYWQVVKAEQLSSLGWNQYGKLLTLFPKRGEIVTHDGFPIATSNVSYLVFANPKEIQDIQGVAKTLSVHLEVPVASISSLLTRDLFWVPIKANVRAGTKETIERLPLSGIGFEEQYTRFYPEASLAATLVGFVGKNEAGEDKGYFGLEGYYDRQLKGKQGHGIQIRDALGSAVVAKISGDLGKVDGRSLVLHIDRAIQFAVERKLKDGIERYGADGGMAIVMNPKTGAILAMANVPSFDPATYHKYDPKLFTNPLISYTLEPGSTFKSLVMAAALDAKVVRPETKCSICKGPITIADYTIRTWDNQYYEDTNMIEVIQHSDNTGIVFVARTLGLDKLLTYFDKFGIGKLSNVDLQGEVTSSLRPKKAWYPIDLATAGFGQGISVTPIQFLSAFSAIANEGKRMEPHVVEKIKTPDGKVVVIAPKVVAEPIAPQTARVMTEMLVNAVNKGEAKWTRLKGYRVAGKTGTAQIPIAGHYDPDKTITSFMGFAPADDPQFAMLVILDKPTRSIYGSETAAPIFFDIAKDILTYYGIAPTEAE